jgi:hypothetical protein
LGGELIYFPYDGKGIGDFQPDGNKLHNYDYRMFDTNLAPPTGKVRLANGNGYVTGTMVEPDNFYLFSEGGKESKPGSLAEARYIHY